MSLSSVIEYKQIILHPHNEAAAWHELFGWNTPLALPEVVLPAVVVHRSGFGCGSSTVQPPSVLLDIWLHLNSGNFVLTMQHLLSPPGRLKECKGTKQNFIFPGIHGQKLQARSPLQVVFSDDAK